MHVQTLIDELSKLPPGADVVIATDCDWGGEVTGPRHIIRVDNIVPLVVLRYKVPRVS